MHLIDLKNRYLVFKRGIAACQNRMYECQGEVKGESVRKKTPYRKSCFYPPNLHFFVAGFRLESLAWFAPEYSIHYFLKICSLSKAYLVSRVRNIRNLKHLSWPVCIYKCFISSDDIKSVAIAFLKNRIICFQIP